MLQVLEQWGRYQEAVVMENSQEKLAGGGQHELVVRLLILLLDDGVRGTHSPPLRLTAIHTTISAKFKPFDAEQI